jgi:fucose 4-O-acetylase-like acetyltransferase
MVLAFCIIQKEPGFSISFLINIFNGILAAYFLYVALNKSYILPLDSRFEKVIDAFQNAIVYLGKSSMPIYLFHVHFGATTRMLLVKFIHTKSPSMHLIVGVIVATIGPIILYEILKPRSKLFTYSIGESK